MLGVFWPVNALPGMAPIIWVKVKVLKSGANVKATKDRLALVPTPVVKLRETLRLRLEPGPVDWLREANSPSWLNLNIVVWAVRARGCKVARASSIDRNTRFISDFLCVWKFPGTFDTGA